MSNDNNVLRYYGQAMDLKTTFASAGYGKIDCGWSWCLSRLLQASACAEVLARYARPIYGGWGGG
jgi:hypothetical protein